MNISKRKIELLASNKNQIFTIYNGFAIYKRISESLQLCRFVSMKYQTINVPVNLISSGVQ